MQREVHTRKALRPALRPARDRLGIAQTVSQDLAVGGRGSAVT
jgi:hypothetical protein